MIRTEIDCHALKRHFNDSVIRECVGAWENHLHKKYSFSNWSTPDKFYKGRSQEKTHLLRPEFFLLLSPLD
jgi:hypothetical protein